MEEPFWAILEWNAFRFHLELLKKQSSKIIFGVVSKKHIINDIILVCFMWIPMWDIPAFSGRKFCASDELTCDLFAEMKTMPIVRFSFFLWLKEKWKWIYSKSYELLEMQYFLLFSPLS